MAAKGGKAGGRPPRVPGAPPPLPRAARRQTYPRNRGTSPQILWHRARRAWARGDALQAIHVVSLFATGLGAGLIANPSQRVATVGKVLSTASAAVTIPTGIRAAQMRAAFDASPQNLRHMRLVRETENIDWLRRLDREFVERYSIDPKSVERELGVSVVGAASTFASARRLRKAPDAPYSIKKHEGKTYHSIVRPILQFHVGQLPKSVDKKALLERHYPREGLRPKTRKQLPSELVELIPEHLLTADPQTPQEAVALSLLAGSIARARLKEFRNG